MPWPTGSLPPGDETIARVLVIPRTVEFMSAVNGALLPLLDPALWEQTGDLTEIEAAQLMSAMFYNYLDSAP